MPTKVVIRAPPQEKRARASSNDNDKRNNVVVQQQETPLQDPPNTISKTPICGVVGFRSSVRAGRRNATTPTHANRKRRYYRDSHLHLSRDDLRASPRLQGYLYMLVASIVMLVSAVRFYVERDDVETVEVVRGLEEEPDSGFTNTFGARVLTWKLYGAIVVSAAGVGISLFVLLVHFDSICLPRVWKFVFHDGSKWELAVLMSLLVFWMGGLHICTSAFSVGEVAPNVYFTTWIAFASVAVNVGVWRQGADLPLLVDVVRNHHRETFYGWFTVFVFGLVTALSIAELYANRDELEFLLDGEVQQVPQREWNKALGSSFAVVGTSLLNLACAHYLSDKPLRIPLCYRNRKLNLDWRQVEGFFALSVLGLFSWFIYEYTGVNSALSGPSNPYFGSWGIWFSSILTFGSWVRENKHIEFILREEEEETESET